MSVEKTESPIPFIDDGEEVKDGEYNLTITRNYKNKTRRVEISKILQDVEPMTNRSLSPVAPLAYESDADGGKSSLTELTGAEFELTIKSNNSVIKIQGFDNKSTISFNASKGENVYDALSKEVDKIFKKPEREEIEKAVRSIKEKRKLKPLCRQRRNTWKAIAKSIVGLRGVRSSQRRGSVERYPKMVLLEDPKPTMRKAETYPKMVMLEDEKLGLDKCEKNLKREKKLPKTKKTDPGDDERPLKKEADVMEEKLCVELEKQLLEEKKDDEGGTVKVDINQVQREPEDLTYPSVPLYCQYPVHCPYIPMYNRPFPYYHYNEICCSVRAAPQKHSSTQTDPELGQQIDALDPSPDLPFGILSSLFPRIVVMKSFQEDVSSDDAQIYEIPKSETPPPVNEKEDETGCEESEPVQSVDVELNKEPTEDAEELNGEEPAMPLTEIGHSIYDKLNELAMERKKRREEPGAEEKEDELVETDAVKSPRDVTLELNNRVMRFTLGGENLNLEVTDGDNEKTVVRKSDLWHPSNGDSARGSERICVSVSDNRSVILTVRVGEERKYTREAKVGTDCIDIAGGDFACQEGIDTKNLSPRTGKALRTLKDKLDRVTPRKRDADFKFPGLFLIQPFDSRYRGFPSDDYIMTKSRQKTRDVSGDESREYYCEECLATMRLIEDVNPTVKTMIDKFERIIHLGSY